MGSPEVHTAEVDSPSRSDSPSWSDSPTFSDSIIISRHRDELYDMVSDVNRMGQWSPICKACWWDDGDGPSVGAWFTGRNESPERTGDTRSQWETRSEVTVADRGREFTFVVGGSWIQWSYTFTDTPRGTRVAESWAFLPEGIARFHDRFGDDAEAQIAQRIEAAHRGIPETLAAIKRVAEAES
jgi:Polyketide cyclase / dehydrase and lipid transport